MHLGEERGADGGTVLVIDDERGPRESLRMILRPSHAVLLACDGSQGLDLLRTSDVDVVTLDLDLPGLRGEALLPRLRLDFPDVEVVVITGRASVESAADAVRYGAADYITKPFDVVQVMASVDRAVARRRARGRADTGPRAALQARADADQARDREFLPLLAETIEAQHPFMHGHSQRVGLYAGLLADRLCLSVEEKEHLRVGALLHDVGKIGVPTELLVRPGALDARERAVVEQHTLIGARLLEPIAIASQVTSTIRHHHEWWDGRGYPDGLHGERIPLCARIVAIADSYDAMSCDRPYRGALPRELVMRELHRFAGMQFDPLLAKEFLALVESADVDLHLLAGSLSAARRSFESAGPSADPPGGAWQ